MNRIAIYSRKSKETDTGESIKNQIDMCKSYFNRKDTNCTFEIFQDEGFSGGNINRPSFQKMIKFAKNKQFDIIAVYKVDRIARNIVDFVNIYDELERHDVKLVSITEGFDPSTPIGKMMMMLLASFAEMERMNIAQRVKDNMNALAKMGRWSGGTAPTGYKSKTININGKKEVYLELIKDKRHMLEIIFQKAADGYTTYQIGKLIKMSSKTVANIISNPTYVSSDKISSNYLKSIGYNVFGKLNGKGYLVYNRRPRKKGKKLFNAKGMFVAVSEHEPVIDSKTWIVANRNLKNRATESKPRISSQSFLAHLVKCSCGSSMYITTGNLKKDGTRNVYFVCSKKKSSRGKKCNVKWLRVDFAESFVLNVLEKMHLNSESLENYLKHKKKSTNYDQLIKDIKYKLNKNIDIINNLTEKLILLDGAAIDVVCKKINKLSNENTILNEKLTDLEKKKLFSTIDVENSKILISNINKFLKNFNKIDITEKQNFAQSILESVIWDSSITNAKGKKGKLILKFLS
ncbi:recombinase family protein [Clostridium botulinum]|uniref:Resolvase n=1 Tax=Clostridium botulinum C/D str. DC5 TaxID=1443128 RepID=A0A0A0ILX1_CLOBO|nr:recombinase family protein [Clostridium botulinum]KEI07065.1 resolvase [Clostridium botulinum C/D str. BKT75002]KEI12142.1 resolvase [Clostridium botulinum C/D str. BKT2873]KGN01958.1 resolvase [Clostridium botulinum C/D str. DC5]KOC48595.1 resolvase [Clostridium botulinum]KOC55593.1 resolvase [Clostridium botulinum]